MVAEGQTVYYTDSSGNLVAGSDELVVNNGLFGGAGRDTIDGLTGSDLLGGFGGNDMIEGGDGADMIGGDAGADTIKGGAGDDYISSSTDVYLNHQLKGSSDVYLNYQLKGPSDQWRLWGLPAGKEAVSAQALWGTCKKGDAADDSVVWSGISDVRTDTAASEGDSVDAGAGNDWVMASWAADRLQGGEGDDRIDSLAGNVVGTVVSRPVSPGHHHRAQ